MRNRILILSLMLAFVFSISLTGSGFAKDEQVTITGNVICLLPDYQKGTVNPVIADGPCKNQPPHEHLLVSNEGTVYYLQGLQEGLMKVQLNPAHKGVQVTGRAEQTPGGWILYVE